MENPGPGSDKDATVALARERVQTAILELSGERGYRAVDLELLLVRAAVTEAEFDRHFRDLADCFASAYRHRADSLRDEMLRAAAREREWRGATRAALDVVLGFVAERPAIGRALVREVHVAGGAALAKHEEVLERLAAALASCGELPADDLARVSRAPGFIVGAVEGVIAGHLDRGEPEDLLRVTPELMYLIAASLLGREAAAGETES
jgi:AcrR family transcriptional regulator